MTTTYSVNWRTGKGAATTGLLEITPDAVVFTPADGRAAARVSLDDVPAVRRRASTVELERRSGESIRIESVAAGALGARLEAVVGLAAILRTLREEHDRMAAELGELRTAVDALPSLTNAREQEFGLLATDLMRRIVQHARVEEQELYPVVEQMLGCQPLVEAMLFDHRAIEGESRDLIRIAAGDRARLACVFHRLDALLTTHVAKEEAIVFPMLETR